MALWIENKTASSKANIFLRPTKLQCHYLIMATAAGFYPSI
jgi:hypothetical protein